MSFFTTLPANLQQSLQQLGVRRQLENGEVLIARGGFDKNLFVLEIGALRVDANLNGQELSIDLKPGDVVGEMAFLDNRPRTATVVASSPSTVLVFDREATR